MSRFTKRELELLSNIIKVEDLLDIEIALIIINKYHALEELFYNNYDKIVEEFGEDMANVFTKCLDILWDESRE